MLCDYFRSEQPGTNKQPSSTQINIKISTLLVYTNYELTNKRIRKYTLIKCVKNIINVKNIKIMLIKEAKDHCNENLKTQEKYKILEDQKDLLILKLIYSGQKKIENCIFQSSLNY